MAEVNSGQAWVWLARIRKAQGRKGEVFADLLTDFPEKFKERKRVWLLDATGPADEVVPGAAREAELLDSFPHKGGVVLRFTGIASIPEADALRGKVVAIPWAERAQLGDDELYIGDLIGCLLIDVSVQPSKEIGVIEDIDREAGPVSLLVVRAKLGANGGDGVEDELLVPFAKAYLRRIELEAKVVEMSLPEGLIEVQRQGKA